MEKDWIIVYTTDQPFRAEMLKQFLEDHNVDSVIINKMDSSYKTFGDIEVYVKRDCILLAKKLIKEFEVE